MSTFKNLDGSTQVEKIAAPVSHRSHGFAAEVPARHGGKPNIARDAGRGKEVRAVPFAGGMTRQQTDVAGLGGRGHAVVVDGGNGNPLSRLGIEKTANTPPRSTPGMRNRRGDSLNGCGGVLDGANVIDPDEARAVLGNATKSGGQC
jgi:hypothetical protein